MKINFLIILLAFVSINVFAQTDSLTNSMTIQKDIEALNEKIVSLESSIEEFKNTKENQIARLDSLLSKQQKRIDKIYKELDKEYRTYRIVKKQLNAEYRKQQDAIEILTQIINTNSTNIEKTGAELGVKVNNINKTTSQNINDLSKTTNQSITDLSKAVSQNTLYWIIAILVVALLVLLVFILLRKQLFKQKTDLDSDLQKTRKMLEEEGIKLDKKLIEVLETQLKIISSNSSDIDKEADHTLALKVADEIIRIQKNLTRMDEKTKGLICFDLSMYIA